MTIHLTFTDLTTALDADAWEWLQETNVRLARALQAEIDRGATAEDVRRFATRYGVPSQFLAAKLWQAAAHLERERARATAHKGSDHEVRNAG